MSFPSDHVLVVIGCGPGIGVATAGLFAAHAFNKIALVARDASRLKEHRLAVLDAARVGNKQPEVQCWNTDISDSAALNTVLSEVQSLGKVSCVLFNAARVGPSPFFEFSEEDLVHDFLTTNVALYTTAKWAIPLLQKPGLDRPTLLVTNSLLWQTPIAPLFSLSLTKASQRSMVQSLQATYKDVHIAMLYVAGEVSPEDTVRSPDLIAKKYLELWGQEKASWSLEMEI